MSTPGPIQHGLQSLLVASSLKQQVNQDARGRVDLLLLYVVVYSVLCWSTRVACRCSLVDKSKQRTCLLLTNYSTILDGDGIIGWNRIAPQVLRSQTARTIYSLRVGNRRRRGVATVLGGSPH